MKLQSRLQLFLLWIAFVSVAQAQPPPVAPGLVLSNTWNSRMQGGSVTMRELATLISPVVTAAPNVAAYPGLEIYPGITYLMPVKEAARILNVGGSLPFRTPVPGAGFPRESFYSYKIDGLFEAGYSHMEIVVDRTDQVVSIQLVEEAPKRGQLPDSWRDEDQGWTTYNFVSYGIKAIRNLKISAKVVVYAKEESEPSRWEPPSYAHHGFDVIRIDTVLFNPEARTPDGSTESRPLKAARWYLPVPFAQLILYCIKNSMNSPSL